MVLKERLKQGWIHSVIVIEVLGKPKEYLSEVMGEVADAIGKHPGVEIVERKIHEPKEANNLFSTFAELEVAVKDLKILSDIVFAYMPSHIEILAPAELKISLNDATQFINLLAAKLHGYDSITKRFKVENMILKKKLVELGELPEEVKEADEMESIKRAKADSEDKENKKK